MSFTQRRFALIALIGLALSASGCGIRSSVETAVEEGAEAAHEAAEEAATEVAEEVAESALDEAAETVEAKVSDAVDEVTSDADPFDATIRAEADSLAETTLADGGRIAVAVQCESLQGGNLIYVGVTGVAPGLYEGDLEPAAGGGVDFGVADDGRGLSIRQTTLDQATYTVSYPMIDSGVSLTVDGCPQ